MSKRIGICTPLDDYVASSYCLSLAKLMNYVGTHPPDGVEKISLHTIRSSVLPLSRHNLVTMAMQAEATHVLWIDSDMGFPHDALHQLLQWDKEIVGVNARMRGHPWSFTAKNCSGNIMETSEDSHGLEPAQRIGLGVALMQMRIFETLDPPWFDVGWERVSEHKFRCLGEDYYLFQKCEAQGFRCWVDHDLSKQISHWAGVPLKPGNRPILEPEESPAGSNGEESSANT